METNKINNGCKSQNDDEMQRTGYNTEVELNKNGGDV